MLVVSMTSVNDGSGLVVLVDGVLGVWLRSECSVSDSSVTSELSIVVDDLLNSLGDLSGVSLSDWSVLFDLLGVVLSLVLSSGLVDGLSSVLGLNLDFVIGDLVFSVLGDSLGLVVSLLDRVGLWDLSGPVDSVSLLSDLWDLSVLGVVDSSVSGLVDGVEDLLWDLSGSGLVSGLFGDDWNLSVLGVVDGLSDSSWDLSGLGLVLSSVFSLGDISVLGVGDGVVDGIWVCLVVGSWGELDGVLVNGVIDNLWDFSVFSLLGGSIDSLGDILGLGLRLVVSLFGGLVLGGWDLVLSDDSIFVVADNNIVVLDGLEVGWALPLGVGGEANGLRGGSKSCGGKEFHSCW